MSDKSIEHLSEEDQAYVRGLREEAKTKRILASELQEKLSEKDARVTELAGFETQLKEVRTKYDSLRDEHAQTLTVGEKAELELTRLKVALDAGLPHSFADRLKGQTADELKADAEAFKTSIGTSTTTGGRVAFDRTSPPPSGSQTEPEFPSIVAHIAQTLGE